MSEFEPDGFESLDARQRKIFGRFRDDAKRIGEEEAEKHGSLEAAKPYIVERLRSTCGSILASILISLLIKIAFYAAWELLKKLWPNTFSGPIPSDAFEGIDS
jgi:hypothetical protein